MSDELGLILLAAIFAAGVLLVALLMISLLPGVLMLESRVRTFMHRRADSSS